LPEDSLGKESDKKEKLQHPSSGRKEEEEEEERKKE